MAVYLSTNPIKWGGVRGLDIKFFTVTVTKI